MKQSIKIQTKEGVKTIKALRRKWLAIAKHGDFWIITYVPLGRSFPIMFFNKVSAIAAAKIARRTFNHRWKHGEYQQGFRVWLDTLDEQEIYFSTIEA